MTGKALNPTPKLNRCLAVFVRDPEPGKIKTRLAKVYGDAFTAELYGCFVDDLLEALAPGGYHLELFSHGMNPDTTELIRAASPSPAWVIASGGG